MKKFNFSHIFNFKFRSTKSDLSANRTPAVFCAEGCDYLALAVVDGKPLCAQCVRDKIASIQLQQVQVTPVCDTYEDSDYGACHASA